jgi:hypothetical protein
VDRATMALNRPATASNGAKSTHTNATTHFCRNTANETPKGVAGQIRAEGLPNQWLEFNPDVVSVVSEVSENPLCRLSPFFLRAHFAINKAKLTYWCKSGQRADAHNRISLTSLTTLTNPSRFSISKGRLTRLPSC